MPARPAPGRRAGRDGGQRHRVVPGQRTQLEANRLLAEDQLVQGLPEERRRPGVLVAHRDRQQRRCHPDPPTEEGEEADAHLVRPLQILQEEDHRPTRSDSLDELGDRLEEPQRSGRGVGVRPAAAQLRQEPAHLHPPDRSKPLEGVGQEPFGHGPQRFDPRAERQDLLGLIAAADEDERATPGGLRREGAAEPGSCRSPSPR